MPIALEHEKCLTKRMTRKSKLQEQLDNLTKTNPTKSITLSRKVNEFTVIYYIR